MIRTSTPSDLPRIRSLLQEAGLPVADLESHGITFLVAEREGQLAGVVGLQPSGSSALLRSLVVAPGLRGTHLGKALLMAAEDLARRLHLTTLILLTTTAARWFEHQGYAPLARAQVPEALRATAEFTHLCPASATCMHKALAGRPDTTLPRNVLFLCTGNSARSLLAESTLRAWGGERFNAFSAGSQPTGQVNPRAIAQLQAEGMPVEGLRSKSWDAFVDAAPMDLVITVCDSAAAEACPLVFGDFIRSHWGQPDPAAVGGSEADQAAAFAQAHAIVKARLRALLELTDAVWADRNALQRALDRIGQLQPNQGVP